MQICNTDDVKSLGTIVSVGAHPDDETFCAGGLLAAAVRNGQKVACITATRGEAGSQDEAEWPTSKMAAVRTQELQDALKAIGVKQLHILDFPDGGLKDVKLAAGGEATAKYIERYQPDTILTFGPDGLTGHPDHQAVSAWVDEAVKLLDKKPIVYHAVVTVDQYHHYLKAADEKLDIFFKTDQPPLATDDQCDICFVCTDELCDCKQEAFRRMPSQYTKMKQAFGQDYLKEAFRVEAFVRAEK